MALLRKMTGLGAAVTLAAVLFGALVASASAQTPPYTAYGINLSAGDVVVAYVDGAECGTDTADAEGQWLIYVEANGDCAPSSGDTISFTLNGAVANETVTYEPAGAPADVANGISLTASQATPTATASPTASATATPGPADTGNAGLLGSTGTSVALILALGIFAAAMVAGGRTATRRS